MVSGDAMKRIRLVRPILGPEETEEARAVLGTGYLTQGPKTQEFENLVAQYLGVEHAIATTSATTALHLAMVLLGIGPGDEVVLPSFTFPATANVVIQQGAIPVLADIELADVQSRHGQRGGEDHAPDPGGDRGPPVRAPDGHGRLGWP